MMKGPWLVDPKNPLYVLDTVDGHMINGGGPVVAECSDRDMPRETAKENARAISRLTHMRNILFGILNRSDEDLGAWIAPEEMREIRRIMDFIEKG